MVVVEIVDKKGKKFSFYIEPRMKKIFDLKILPSLQKKDKDCIICIDGAEGSGKSTLALQLGKYADPTLDLSRVCFSAEDFREEVFKAKKGQCIIYDEAFTGLSSRSSLSGINRALVSLMMQMRQKNLFVIIVLPTYFLLDKYVALFRTRALFHVYETGGRRGYYKVYNKKTKKMLFLLGRQTYSYFPTKVRANIRRCRFYGVYALGDDKDEAKYREKKAKALETSEKTPMTAGQIKYREQRDVLLFLLKTKLDLTYMDMSNLLGEYDLDMSHQVLQHICAKFGVKEKKKYVEEREEKKKKKSQGIKEKEKVENDDKDADETEEIEESESLEEEFD